MRILHITSHLNVGGVTSSILSVSAAMASRGHHVTIASGGGTLAPADGAPVAHWPASLHTSQEFSLKVHLAARRLAARLRREPVDILHGHTRVGQVVAAWLSGALCVPYITTWHGFFRPNLGRRWWPCTGMRTIAISEPVRQHLLTDFHVEPGRIRLIPHGIDPTPYTSPVDEVQQQQLRARLGLPPDAPLVGTVARLVPSKGVDLLIRSLPQIRQAVPAAHLIIVGDGPARPDLERLAQSLGAGASVHFTGTLPETRTALSLMQVFVFLPAEEEGFGLSLLEAMASARPIVAVQRGRGAAWVLEDAKVGSLVPPDEPRALADAVIRYVRDGQAACHDALAARAVVTQRYSLTRMADHVEAVYREMVSSS